MDQKYTAFYTGENSKQDEPAGIRAKKGTSRRTCPLFTADADIASCQGVTCNFKVQRPFLQWEVLVIFISLFVYLYLQGVHSASPAKNMTGLTFSAESLSRIALITVLLSEIVNPFCL